ncbi:MAG: hypothetical protein RMJ55_15580 [Roseiflexaceae bacterium]|nr:hypothetical protein [Roseiflexaceae bacterium]
MTGAPAPSTSPCLAAGRVWLIVLALGIVIRALLWRVMTVGMFRSLLARWLTALVAEALAEIVQAPAGLLRPAQGL